jgi:Domain of unknown function (DUF397)
MSEAITVSTVDLSGLAWRKGSRSTVNGDNGNCVEVAFVWRKSSRSTGAGDNGACVEIASVADRTAVRDSKNPAAGHLTFPAAAFTTFLRSA